VKSLAVNPLPCFLMMFLGKPKTMIPDLRRDAVAGKETIEIAIGSLEIQLICPNDSEHSSHPF